MSQCREGLWIRWQGAWSREEGGGGGEGSSPSAESLYASFTAPLTRILCERFSGSTAICATVSLSLSHSSAHFIVRKIPPRRLIINIQPSFCGTNAAPDCASICIVAFLMIGPYSPPAQALLGLPWQGSALSPLASPGTMGPWEAANGEKVHPKPGPSVHTIKA